MSFAKRVIVALARRGIPLWVREQIAPPSPFASPSYSQEGEDRVLCRLMGENDGATGFYVDVGALHPMRFSNTYAFYLRGWRGINIDACPGSMGEFMRARPNDINLEVAISNTQKALTFYEFKEPAINGFSKELAEENAAKYKCKFSTRTIETKTLAEILDKYLPPGQRIDFMTVDVEGMDEEVLRSNDWDRYRPRFVLAEELNHPPLIRLAESPLVRYMDEIGYVPIAKTHNTFIFRERD
jgi:FkbM family methyltransferase